MSDDRPSCASAPTLMRHRSGAAKRALQLAAEYSLTPKRLDFEGSDDRSGGDFDDEDKLSSPIKYSDDEGDNDTATRSGPVSTPPSRRITRPRPKFPPRLVEEDPQWQSQQRRTGPPKPFVAVAARPRPVPFPTMNGDDVKAICTPPPRGVRFRGLHTTASPENDDTPPRTASCAPSMLVFAAAAAAAASSTPIAAVPAGTGMAMEAADVTRRRSAPVGVVGGYSPGQGDPGRRVMTGARRTRSDEKNTSVGLKRRANINPFTPTSLNISSTIKRAKLAAVEEARRRAGLGTISTPSNDGSFEAAGGNAFAKAFARATATAIAATQTPSTYKKQQNVGTPIGVVRKTSPLPPQTPVAGSGEAPPLLPPGEITGPDEDPNSPLNPAKRIKVSEISISRYEEEFLELQDIACGSFGAVKIARHRLDGMVYAIKVTRTELHSNGYQERSAMNEVFAHAALMKHKHVVRYYNSWVEKGRIFIQNEYCEGGSLAKVLEERREAGRHFSENELRRIATHIAKGMAYVHSKGLVHLDIKPENILLALEPLPSSHSSPILEHEDSMEQGKADNDDVDMDEAQSEGDGDNEASSDEDEDEEDHEGSPQPSTSQQLEEKIQKQANQQSTPRTSRVRPKIHDSTDSGNVSEGSKLYPTAVVDNPSTGDKAGNSGDICQNPEQKCTPPTREPSCSSSSSSPTISPSSQQDRISYKLGDLGHVAQIHETNADLLTPPEEGDCRYMAPEMLLHEVDREKLPKADVFSLGLTLFECATLERLPKNSMENELYVQVREGSIPTLPRYSKEFNQLIKLMVSPDVLSRPSANRILAHPFIRNLRNRSSSNTQLFKQLRDAKRKVRELEKQLEKATKMRTKSSPQPLSQNQ